MQEKKVNPSRLERESDLEIMLHKLNFIEETQLCCRWSIYHWLYGFKQTKQLVLRLLEIGESFDGLTRVLDLVFN